MCHRCIANAEQKKDQTNQEVCTWGTRSATENNCNWRSAGHTGKWCSSSYNEEDNAKNADGALTQAFLL
jgi:hypothetical protein